MIRALRRECFDRSVDFCGNDRGAFLSLFCGARERLGPVAEGGFLGRRFCYTEAIRLPENRHHTLRNIDLLAPWGISTPDSTELEIRSNPALESVATALLPQPAILCHLATSQPKKEWPAAYWAELYRMAAADGRRMLFSTGTSPRELALLDQLRSLEPAIPALPSVPDLATFLAVIKKASLFITGDTGPLHFAAALGVPTLALFGPSPAALWAPFGSQHRHLQASSCDCSVHSAFCTSVRPCMAGILPRDVFQLLQQTVPEMNSTTEITGRTEI
jgi:ADP-heptose:LPS heptosyltransferase